jgi:hypothetical protein
MSIIKYPSPVSEVVVVTRLMKQIISRTLAVHPLSALVVWYGESRMGKTTTALYMERELASAYDANNPLAFRGAYCEVGEITSWYGNEMKRGIKSLYFAIFKSPLDEGVYQKDPPEALAVRLVHELRRRNIQIIFVDEAGCLSVGAIWGMVLVRDIAKAEGWPLTLVFIGMHDLPQKMTRLPQLEGRVHEWCYFEEYNVGETWSLLSQLHPHFAKLNRDNEEHQAQVKFLHETYGGLPGQLVPFLQRMEYRLREYSGTIDLRFLRAVHLLTARDKQQMIEHSLINFHGMPPATAAKKSSGKIGRGKPGRRNSYDDSDSPKSKSKKRGSKRG